MLDFYRRTNVLSYQTPTKNGTIKHSYTLISWSIAASLIILNWLQLFKFREREKKNTHIFPVALFSYCLFITKPRLKKRSYNGFLRWRRHVPRILSRMNCGTEARVVRNVLGRKQTIKPFIKSSLIIFTLSSFQLWLADCLLLPRTILLQSVHTSFYKENII